MLKVIQTRQTRVLDVIKLTTTVPLIPITLMPSSRQTVYYVILKWPGSQPTLTTMECTSLFIAVNIEANGLHVRNVTRRLVITHRSVVLIAMNTATRLKSMTSTVKSTGILMIAMLVIHVTQPEMNRYE